MGVEGVFHAMILVPVRIFTQLIAPTSSRTRTNATMSRMQSARFRPKIHWQSAPCWIT